MRCVVVMGVAGSGKSTVGRALARRMNATYIDGDDLHPPANIAKMSSGQPLSDEDRAPWLNKVGETLRDHPGTCLIGCSALKRNYRDRIRKAANEPVTFLHLGGTRSVIEARMGARTGHFMPLALLDSQFAALEILQTDETGVVVDIDQSFDAVVAELLARLPQ